MSLVNSNEFVDILVTGQDSIGKIVADLRATEKQAEIASLRALNRAIIWLKRQVARDVSKERKIRQAVIIERLVILKANRRNLQAHLNGNLASLRANKVGKLVQTKRGARVKHFHFPGAFVATMPSGHKGIFRRQTGSRLPISEITIPIKLESLRAIEDALSKKLKHRFETDFRRELNFLVNVK